MPRRPAAERYSEIPSSRAADAGLSEACVPLFVAFAFLAVSWLLVALGLHRRG